MRPLSPTDILDLWDLDDARNAEQRAARVLLAAYRDRGDVDIERLTVGERDMRLAALRALTLGAPLDAYGECPKCREQIEFTIPESLVPGSLAEYASPAPAPLLAFGFSIDCRLPTGGDLVAVAACPDPDAARWLLISRCVVEAQQEGKRVAPADLPEEVIERIAAHLEDVDPRGEILIGLICPACGQSWHLLFDIVSFFWAELVVRAKRLFEDVHTLAGAYGWSERDILSMSPRRRRRYLDRVSA
jgi:hypothetical protein